MRRRTVLLAVAAAVALAVGVGVALALADLWRPVDDLALRFFKDDAPANATVSDGQLETKYLDREGNEFDLARYRGRKTVVVVFVRGMTSPKGGFCSFCVPQVGSLAANYGEFAARDAEVAVVFPGPHDWVEKFVTEAKASGRAETLPFPLLLDPGLAAVDRLGIRGSLAKPSTYILDRRGRVVYAYVGANQTDRPSVKALLAQLDALNRTG
jgi:peroxiredoxin